jgi:hypothetical protein
MRAAGAEVCIQRRDRGVTQIVPACKGRSELLHALSIDERRSIRLPHAWREREIEASEQQIGCAKRLDPP